MDQTQTTNPADSTTASVDNDLQKAIDDIANTTSVDPVFSDPVAAPSSVPEGDTGGSGGKGAGNDPEGFCAQQYACCPTGGGGLR